jgi:hypothetical protein
MAEHTLPGKGATVESSASDLVASALVTSVSLSGRGRMESPPVVVKSARVKLYAWTARAMTIPELEVVVQDKDRRNYHEVSVHFRYEYRNGGRSELYTAA